MLNSSHVYFGKIYYLCRDIGYTDAIWCYIGDILYYIGYIKLCFFNYMVILVIQLSVFLVLKNMLVYFHIKLVHLINAEALLKNKACAF